jgi:hypothetical protein
MHLGESRPTGYREGPGGGRAGSHVTLSSANSITARHIPSQQLSMRSPS